MKFSIKNFFSKCDQIRRKLRIWSHLLKKSLMENFIFCAVYLFTLLHVKKKHYLYCKSTRIQKCSWKNMKLKFSKHSKSTVKKFLAANVQFRQGNWLLPSLHCVKNVRIRSFSVRIFQLSDWIHRDTPYLSVFSPNAGK